MTDHLYSPRIVEESPKSRLHISEEGVETEASWIGFAESPFDEIEDKGTPFDEPEEGGIQVETVLSEEKDVSHKTMFARDEFGLLDHRQFVHSIYRDPPPTPSKNRTPPPLQAFTHAPATNEPPKPISSIAVPYGARDLIMEGGGKSWPTTEPSQSQDDTEKSDQYTMTAKPYRYKYLPWCLSTKKWRVWLLLLLPLIILVFFFGLVIATVLRGESVSWRNIFSGTPGITEEPSAAPSLSIAPSPYPSSSPTFVGPPPSNLTVAAYYYPWHGDNFHGGKYLREMLKPPQTPFLGEYDDTQSHVIAQHLSWSRHANIRLWVTSWWGPDRREDDTTLNVILSHKELGEHKIALFYETTGRIRKDRDTKNVAPDIEYICQNYFDHPNYFRINGQPVLFVYLTRELEAEGIMEEVILLMRSIAKYYDHEVFIIGDHIWNRAPGKETFFRPFYYLDAMTSYDVYGGMARKGYAGQDSVDEYYNEQRQWRYEANDKKCGYIPAVSPGFNDRGVRLHANHSPLSRKLTADDEEGSFFIASLLHARYLVDEALDNLLIVNSFNEWHEDTQIEPTVVQDATTEPRNYTGGLEYPGYGALYLDILREYTVEFDEVGAVPPLTLPPTLPPTPSPTPVPTTALPTSQPSMTHSSVPSLAPSIPPPTLSPSIASLKTSLPSVLVNPPTPTPIVPTQAPVAAFPVFVTSAPVPTPIPTTEGSRITSSQAGAPLPGAPQETTVANDPGSLRN
jgi:hypothetical protein